MKRVSTFVISLHLFLLAWLALWSPAKKVEKKPIQVHTIVAVPTPAVKTTYAPKAPPSPKPALKKTPPPPLKKPTLQKAPQKPIVSSALVQQLENAFEKLDEKSDQKGASFAPAAFKLQIDSEEGSIYARDLIQCLQNALQLPQHGAVKLELTLKTDGTFVKMRTIQSANSANQKFLETHLRSIHYPSFSGPLKQEKEHTFVITFCNN